MPLSGITVALFPVWKWDRGQLIFNAKEIECASCNAENCWRWDSLLCVMMLYRLQCVASWAGREYRAPSPLPLHQKYFVPARLARPSPLVPARQPYPPCIQKLYVPARQAFTPPFKSWELLPPGEEPAPSLTRSLQPNHYTTQASYNVIKTSQYTLIKPVLGKWYLLIDWGWVAGWVGRGGGGGVEGTGTQHSPLSLSPILNFDILDSIKPALKLEVHSYS